MSLIADIHRDLEKGAIQLIADYRARLQAEAQKLCGDAASAEDLVCRTIERVIAKIDTYRSDDNFYGWMLTVMGNLHRNDLRRPVDRNTSPVDPSVIEDLTGIDEKAIDAIVGRLDRLALREAIDNLDPEYKQVLLLHFYEELTVRDIAAYLNRPVGTVWRRMQVAIKLLAGKLGVEVRAKKPLAILAAFLLASSLFGAVTWGVVEAAKGIGSLGSEGSLGSLESIGSIGSLESEGALGAVADTIDPKDPKDPKDANSPNTLSTNANTNKEEPMNLKSITKSAAKLAVGAALSTGLAATAVGETYTLAGSDNPGTSALAGTGTVGWRNESGAVFQSHKPCAGNAYVIGDGYMARTPDQNYGKSQFVFGGDSLTIAETGGQIQNKMPDGGETVISNLVIKGDCLLFQGQNFSNGFSGDWEIRDGAKLKIDVNYSGLRVLWFKTDFSGSGTLEIGGGSACASGSGVTLMNSLGGFAGRLVVCGGGAKAPCSVLDLPAQPGEPRADAVKLNDGARLAITGSMSRGQNLGVTFDGSATIDVPAGAVVRIDGPLTGASGFVKTGDGELILGNASPGLSGTVSVTAGTLSHVELQNATVVISGTGTERPIADEKILLASATGYTGYEDDDSHGITVAVRDPEGGAGCTYQWAVGKPEGWSDEEPRFSEAGERTVFCKISADGYSDCVVSATVKITKRTVSATMTGVTCLYDGQVHDPAVQVSDPSTGYQLEWSKDGKTFTSDPLNCVIGVFTAYCRISKAHYTPLVLSCSVSVKFAGTMFVSPDGLAVAPYNTQENAATNLAEALALVSIGSGSTVIVASGNYTLNKRSDVPLRTTLVGPDDRSARISGSGGLDVKEDSTVSGLTFDNVGAPNVASLTGSVITNCSFVNSRVNSVNLGGTMVDCDITDFVGNGGAERNYGLVAEGQGPVSVIRTRIRNGTIGSFVQFSAPVLVDVTGPSVLFEDCEISGNTNKWSASAAGAMVCKSENARIVLNRCAFTGNTGRAGVIRGGAGGADLNTIYTTNCLFAGNTSIDTTGEGITTRKQLLWAKGEFVNCTFADNSGSEVFYCETTSGDKSDQITLLNCVISGNEKGTFRSGGVSPVFDHAMYPECAVGDANGNITGPALFFGKGKAPYRLDAASPGVGAGALLGWTSKDVDLAGRRRLRGGKVDMGCYACCIGMMLLIQ